MDLTKKGFSLIDNTYRYSIDKLLSYDRFLSIAYGGRRIGKTYSTKAWATSRFEKREDRFLYIRRHNTQLVNMKDFFSDFTGECEYKKKSWTVRTKEKEPYFLYDGEIGGYYSYFTQLINKGIIFENVGVIIFDEFMTTGGYQRYMPNEFNDFLGIIATLNSFMRNDMRVILLANNTSLYNPYFLNIGYTGSAVGEFWAPKLKGELPEGETGYKYDTVIQRVDTDERLKAAFRNSRFGRFIAGSDYAEHSIENKSLLDTNDFIRKKTGDCSPIFNFIIDGSSYSVWCSLRDGSMYVAAGKSQALYTYSASDKDFVEGAFSIYSLKANEKYKYMVDAYNGGRMFYESSKCKSAAIKMMSNIMRVL